MRRFIFVTLFFSSYAFGQLGAPKVGADTIRSFTNASFLFLNDSTRVRHFLELDSLTGIPNTSSTTEGLRIFSWKNHLYVRIPDGNVIQLDSTWTASADSTLFATRYWVLSQSYLTAVDSATKFLSIGDAYATYQPLADTSTKDATRYWVIQQGYLTAETGDISAVTVTSPISGGGTSGSVNITTSMNTARLIGRTTASTGVMEEISVSSALSLSSGSLGVASPLSLYAGITPSSNVQSLLGAADYSAMRTLLSLVVGTNVQAYDADLATLASPTAWRSFYSDGSGNIAQLAFGTSGKVLTSNGVSSAPTWETPSGGAGGVDTVQESDASPSYTSIKKLNFNATNFSLSQPSAGVAQVNTIQDIGTGASPTFNGLNISANLNVSGEFYLNAFSPGMMYLDGDPKLQIIDFTADDSVLMTSGGIAAFKRIKKENIDANARIDATMLTDGSVSNTEFGYINTVTSNVQTQLNAKQASDADLTTIAGLTATTDNFIVSVSSAWASRTPAQAKTTLSLNNVTNESKATMFTSPTFTGTVTMPTAVLMTDAAQIQSGITGGNKFSLSGYNEDLSTYEDLLTVTSVFGLPTIALVRPSLGVATGTSLAVTGLVTSSGTAGIGYATGAGGTVTQATSKTTGVTLNKTTGTITMNNAALAAAAEAKFTVTNSTVAATDIPVLAIKSGGTSGSYMVCVSAVAAGSFDITIENVSAGSLSEAVVISFAIIKGVAG